MAGLLKPGLPWSGDCPPFDHVEPVAGESCYFFTDGPTRSSEGYCCYTLMNTVCSSSGGAGGIGRPFVVAGEARRPAVAARGDWQRAFDDQSLTQAISVELSRAWLEDARLEHASVASFARLSLELLSLGAPAELVEGALRAGLDEVEHARLCFGLASRYARVALGPSALPTSDALGQTSLLEVAVASVRDGCVQETVGALIAQAQLDAASDPAVRQALARIAADEANHAELAWKIARWAIARGGCEVRRAAARAFEEARSRCSAPSEPLGPAASELSAHGRLDALETRRVVARAWRELIEPLKNALLETGSA